MKERLIARKREKSAAPVNERALHCPQKEKKCRYGK